MRNNSGKTITIFLILFLILLVCSTSISLFFFLKESETRKRLEAELQQTQTEHMKLQTDAKELQKQLTIAQEKNKEWEDKYNGTLDDLELEQSLREEMKTENAALKEALASESKTKEKIREELTKTIEEKTTKISDIQKELEDAQKKGQELESKLADMEKKTNEQPVAPVVSEAPKIPEVPPVSSPGEILPDSELENKDVELDKIVVNPDSNLKGRVLSVDKDSEFIIVDLGIKDGLKKDDILSVYRGSEYLGDVRISRLQDEIAAADLVPPFSSRLVRKNDAVVPKKFD